MLTCALSLVAKKLEVRLGCLIGVILAMPIFRTPNHSDDDDDDDDDNGQAA